MITFKHILKITIMKLKNLLIATIAAVSVFAACNKEPQETPSNGLQIKLNASLYNFTKATDTAFEANDAISVNLYKGEDSYINNAMFTYNGSALTSETQYNWYPETDVVGTITAFYPYATLAEGATNHTFTINADQSTVANFKASDFMTARTTSSPTENSVILPFTHALAKIVVTIVNETTETVNAVMLTGVKGSVSYDLKTGAISTTGSAGTVSALNNNNTWEVIIAPQTASPELVITTASEKQYTFTLAEDVTFNSGKYSTAAVTITTETISTSFTPNIQDWLEDNTLEFTQNPEENEPETPGDAEGEENGNENGEGENTDPVTPGEGNDEGEGEGENTDPVTPGEGEGEDQETPSSEVRIYLSDAWGWTYLWCWDSNGAQIFDGAAWPGTVKHGEVEGYYYWVVPEAYVGRTVSLLFVKKTETEQEQSADYTNVTLSEDCYFHLEWTQETGVQVIPEEK